VKPLRTTHFIYVYESKKKCVWMPQHPQALIIKLLITTFSSSENVPALNGDVPVLNLLLKFITTNLQVPPTVLERKIANRFLQLQNSLPDAQSCFNIILLPVKYDKTEEFNKAMLTSLQYASCSFASGF